MRIAALTATEEVSGPGRQLAALAPRLSDHGIEMLVLLFHRSTGRRPQFADYLERSGVPYELVRDRGPADWKLVGRVRKVLEAHRVSVVQTHAYKATAVAWALHRGRAARPWIGFFHGSTDKGAKDRLYQGVERRMLPRADRIVVISRRQAAAFAGVEARVRIVDNAAVALPPGDPAEEAAIERSLATMTRPRLGVVGRLSREKGVDIFLRSCHQLRARGQPFSAVVAGDGPTAGALRKLSRVLGLEQQVRFLGRVASVGAVLRHIDLLVLPSRSEGLPNVLLEALSADLPVVATAVGAVPEVLRLPGSGVVVPPEDPAALATGILSALAAGAGPSAARARQHTLARYSLDRRVEQHVHLYHEVAGATGHAGATAG